MPSTDKQRSSSRGRGFAGMDEARRREIASKGGRTAHARGTAHEFDSAEAREAGRKGGQATQRSRGAAGNGGESAGEGEHGHRRSER